MSLQELKSLSKLLDNSLTPLKVVSKENSKKSASAKPTTPTADHKLNNPNIDNEDIYDHERGLYKSKNDPLDFIKYPSMTKELSDQKPWKNDPHYFKKSYISSLALLKMTIHAQRGGSIEIMGMLVGKIIENCIIVMDVYPLPVEGTETRVNAQAEGYEYMVQYLEFNKQLPVHKGENIVGWYHSHPGYGCWLSGIDVATQATNQNFQDPYLAIVIDPLKTLRQRKVEIGAFRTFPDNYTPSKAMTSKLHGGPNLPKSKRKDFGAHSDKYYSLDIEIFNNINDEKLIKEILNNEDKTSIIWLKNLMINKSSGIDQSNGNHDHKCIHGKLDKDRVIKGGNLLHNFDIGESNEADENNGDGNQYQKNNLNLIKLNKKLLDFDHGENRKLEHTFGNKFNKQFEYMVKRGLLLKGKSKGITSRGAGGGVNIDMSEDYEVEEEDDEDVDDDVRDDNDNDNDDEDDLMDESDLEKESQGVSDEGDDDVLSVESGSDMRMSEDAEDQDMEKKLLRRSVNSGLTLNLGRRDNHTNKPRRGPLFKEKRSSSSALMGGQQSPSLRRSIYRASDGRENSAGDYFGQDRSFGFGYDLGQSGGGSSSNNNNRGSGFSFGRHEHDINSGNNRVNGFSFGRSEHDGENGGGDNNQNYRVRPSNGVHNKKAINFTRLAKHVGQQEINQLIVQDIQSKLFL
ncbi:JAB1/Mov34/MPN/PAD-1 ubiquitin protease-domain-containing protein [Scheffersomyces coipomensis]|uniref:JAB1/Mov34/MPN/PAD-1 ubiquitin protease-domain-containing protein n=1 Tax=Scheffersomyces coipomensis TaxID=1788519 RepID=UPI00315DBD49